MYTESNAASITNETNTTTGWYTPGSTLITSDANNPYMGTYAIKAEATSTADNDRNIRYTFNATVGDVFDISIWAKTGSQSVDPAFASWSGVSGFTNPTPISSSSTWTEYNFTVTATSSTVVIRIYTGSSSQGTSGDILYIDSVSILKKDIENPTAPTLSSDGVTANSVNLSWSGATDNIGVTGYKIYKDGILESTLNSTNSCQITGLSASTSYNFTITAIDNYGNESSLSNVLSITTSNISSNTSPWLQAESNISFVEGNVGIGTNSFDSKLTVKGKIHAEEIKVDLSVPAPDYVFKKDYKLKTLEETQKYINENGHLPNIPSAKELEENGLELGIMNMKLLEKIEELTLYIIQLEKENKKMMEFEERLKSIENKLK
tara:strand:- start:2677 stop:3810 length:1134 start_codon:yes stop_codon:yes gene_type:complete